MAKKAAAPLLKDPTVRELLAVMEQKTMEEMGAKVAAQRDKSAPAVQRDER